MSKKVLKVVAVVSNDAHHHLLLPLFSLSNFFAVSHNCRRCVCVCVLRLGRVLAHYCRARSFLRAMGNNFGWSATFLFPSSLVVPSLALFSAPCSLLDFGSGRAITLREEKERQKEQQKVAAAVERRSQSIYRQFTKLR